MQIHYSEEFNKAVYFDMNEKTYKLRPGAPEHVKKELDNLLELYKTDVPLCNKRSFKKNIIL